MATKYWVGGDSVWSSLADWVTSSGGAGNAGFPTSTDDVIFGTLSNARA